MANENCCRRIWPVDPSIAFQAQSRTGSGSMREGRPDGVTMPDRTRIEDELEQLRVAIENAREEAAALADERNALRQELAQRTSRLREVEHSLRQREAAGETA